MILRSPTENQNGRSPGIDCHPERSEGSAFFLTPLETDNKQILRRCAPQNDIATRPRDDGQQALQPQFSKEMTKLKVINFIGLSSPRLPRTGAWWL